MYHIQNNVVERSSEATIGSSGDWDFQDQTGCGTEDDLELLISPSAGITDLGCYTWLFLVVVETDLGTRVFLKLLPQHLKCWNPRCAPPCPDWGPCQVPAIFSASTG